VNLQAAALRGSGNVRVPALVTLVGAIVTIPISPVLIFGLGPFPRLGIGGAGIAFGLYYTAAMLYLLRYMASGRSGLTFRIVRLRGRLFADILKVGVPTAAGLPVTHRGVAQDFHVISVHVPPGDERSTVDWAALARSEGTLVLLMSLERVGAIARALMKHGRAGVCPVSVIADGTMPTQRTIYSTLEGVERRLVDEGVRSPAVVVIGGVVTVAVELAALARDLGS